MLPIFEVIWFEAPCVCEVPWVVDPGEGAQEGGVVDPGEGALRSSCEVKTHIPPPHCKILPARSGEKEKVLYEKRLEISHPTTYLFSHYPMWI